MEIEAIAQEFDVSIEKAREIQKAMNTADRAISRADDNAEKAANSAIYGEVGIVAIKAISEEIGEKLNNINSLHVVIKRNSRNGAMAGVQVNCKNAPNMYFVAKLHELAFSQCDSLQDYKDKLGTRPKS